MKSAQEAQKQPFNLRIRVYSFYQDLRTIDPQTPYFALAPPPPHLQIPWLFTNGMDGQDYGAEGSLNWNVAPRWKLSGSYSLLKMNLHLNPTSMDTTSLIEEKYSPENQFNLRSYWNITHNVSFDTSLYFVGALPGYGVPSYTRLDSRLAWHIRKQVEASIVGQNLLSPRHFEFGGVERKIASQAERSVFGEITVSF